MQAKKKQSVFKVLFLGVIFSFIGIVVNLVGGIVLKIILARLLGPEEFGLVNLSLAVLVLVSSLSLMGYQNGVTRFTAFYKGQGEKGKIKTTIKLVWKIVLFSSCLGGLIVYLFSGKIGVNIFHDPKLIPVLKILAFAIPLLALSSIFNAGLRGLKKIHLVVITDRIVWRIMPLVLISLLFVFFNLQLNDVAYSFLITVAMMLLFSAIFLYKEIIFYPDNLDRQTCLRDITRYSWPVALFEIGNTLKGRTDTFLIAFFLGAYEVGIFAVALTLSASLQIFLSSIIIIFNPVASELYGENNIDEIGSIFSLVTKWLILLAFPILLFLVFFSKTAITVLFGASYENAAPVLAILSICFFAKTAVGPSGTTLLSLGHSKINMRISIAALMVSILLCILLIPRFGLIGAAIATGFATIFQQVSMYVMMKRFVKARLFRKSLLLYAGYCIVLGGGFKMYLENFMNNLPGLSLFGVFFYFLALCGIIITRQLERDDLVLIERVRRKVKSKLIYFTKTLPVEDNTYE